MLTELWAPGLLGYLSHSRKLTAARKETSVKGARAYTEQSEASSPDKKLEHRDYVAVVSFSIICIARDKSLMFSFFCKMFLDL